MSFSVVRLVSIACLLLAAVASVSAQSTTWYWSYTLIPYYTWNSEWYVCASGTMTSSTANANFDGSFLATAITGTRTYYDPTGAYPNPITGLSTADFADNRFWPSGSPNAAIDGSGLSYTVSGTVYSTGGTTSGGANNAINLYLEAGQIVEADLPGGDVLGYMTISQTQSAIAACPASTSAPTVQTWSWMYTLTASDSSYVCASGHLTTWVGYSNGSYQVEDVQGTRYLYTPSYGLSAVGIGGVSQPYSNGGNTNLVYPSSSGGSAVDSGGLAVNLNSAAAYGATLTAGSTTLLIRGGSTVSELSGPSVSSSTFTIVPWSASAAQCNSSSSIAALPSAYASSVTTYNFVYTLQPYYTWDSVWSVCTSGTMTVFTARNNSDGSNTVMGMTGVRRFANSSNVFYQQIVELILPGEFEGNDNKIWLAPRAASINGGFAVDVSGISYNVNGTAIYANGGANGGAVNLYVSVDTVSGTNQYFEADNNVAPQDTTGSFIIGASAGAAVASCPALSTTLQNYNYQYIIKASSSFAVCVTGQLQAASPNLDGGLQVLNVNGNRFVYTPQGSASQGIGGVGQVALNGYANNNELYPTAAATAVFTGDGLIYSMYEPVQIAGNFSAAYSVGITFINGVFYEYEPTGTQTASQGMTGTWSMSTTAAYSCSNTPSDYGVTAATAQTGSITAYFSYTLAPYYTWDGEWSVCASGTITATAQQNADYSYTATNVQGMRRYVNNSGTYTQTINGASSYDGGDSYFWLTANAYLHPPVDLGGFSYTVTGLGGLVLVPNTASGNSNQTAANFFMIQSPWPATPNWFATPSLVLSEADMPTGDVISSAVFSLAQADVLNCATYAVPTTKLWQFYYTQQSSTNEYFVCGSGQLTTWVANAAGGLLMIDVEGFRNFYVTQDAGFGTQFVFSTGLDGVYGPLEWATNDNYVYPQNSGTPSVLDSNGILMVAAPEAYFTPDWEANFVELVSNGQNVYEFLDPVNSPGTGLTGSMYLWAYGSSGVKTCNTTNPPSPFPANLYYAFRYTITPYYTWDGYWSVCASGIMTVTGWSAQVYAGPIPAGTAYAVIGITGTRQFNNNGAVTTQTITGLLQPWDDSYQKTYQGSAISNNNMIYPGAQAVDLNGVSYLLSGNPVYANGYNGDSNIVNVYNDFYLTGSNLTSVFEQGTEDGGSSGSVNTEGTISFAAVSSATATAPSAQQCSSLTAPQQRAYAFIYSINGTSNGNNWQVCASGQLWTNYVAADGGQVVMEIRGSRYFNYPASTYYSTFVQGFSGMSGPMTYNNNDNLVYPNRPSQYLSSNGVLANTNYQITQYVTGPSPNAYINFAAMSNSNSMYEVGGPSSGLASNFQLMPSSTTGQNPTCRAPYSAAATQTLYFSYSLTFSQGSVCASGAITTLSVANSDGTYTAVWISGFRSYNWNGAWTNATITGLAPQAGGSGGPTLTGDNKVTPVANSFVTANGLFYQTDNLQYFAPNTSVLQGSGWIAVQWTGSALTESGCAGCGAASSGITASSGVVSSNPAAVVQCGTSSVSVGAGVAANSGGTSNSGGGNGRRISNGAIAGAVVGSVVGALILCIILALCISRGVFGGKGGKSYATEDNSVNKPVGANGSSRFTPMEDSRGGGGTDMEMSHVERTGETEATA